MLKKMLAAGEFILSYLNLVLATLLSSTTSYAARFSSLADILEHQASLWLGWDHLQYALNIILAALMGSLIGRSHQFPKINVTPRTFSAICFATALAGSINLQIYDLFHNPMIFSSSTGVLSGMGFIAGAVILKLDNGVYGLTTAATLWGTGAIGLAIGLEFYTIGVLSTLILSASLFLVRNTDE